MTNCHLLPRQARSNLIGTSSSTVDVSVEFSVNLARLPQRDYRREPYSRPKKETSLVHMSNCLYGFYKLHIPPRVIAPYLKYQPPLDPVD